MLEKFNFNDGFFAHVIQFSGEPCFLSTLHLSFALCPGATFNSFNFQRTIINNHLSVLFWPLVSSVKDNNFQSTSVSYQIVLKNIIRVPECMEASSIFMKSCLEGSFIQY